MAETIKSLEKQLKELKKIVKKERKEAELKRKIKELKYRKLIEARERIRKGAGRLGTGTKKLWKKMEEIEKKSLHGKKRKKVPQEDYLSRLNKALS